MPKRNSQDLDRLAESLRKLNSSKPKHLILCGDLNCPHIIWDNLTVRNDPNVQDRNTQQQLIDLSVESDLTQVHEEPTRNVNLLDLVITTDPTLVKSSVNAPSISDHDIHVVVTDTDIKPI